MRHRHGFVAFAIVILTLTFGTARADDADAVGQWQTAAPLPYFPVHVHLLPTGKVMIWPGDGVTGNNPRIWDPATQNLTTPTLPGYDIFCAGHTSMADGSLFVAGGHIQNNEGLSHASKYNPLTDSWSILPDMNAGRWYPTTTTLANGDVLTVGGHIDTLIGGNPLPQIFQIASGTWRDLTSAQLGVDQYPRLLLAPNGKVFYPSPTAITRYLNTDGTGAWTYVATRPSGYRDYGTAVMYEPGKVLTVGGGNPPTSAAEVIDLNAATPSWRNVTPMHFARRHNNSVLLPDGTVLVTGGTSGPGENDPTPSNSVYAAELWDPATETWTVMASASVQRIYHSAAILLPDGRVLSTGGNGHTEAEIFSPPYLFKGARPTVTAAPDSVTYGEQFTVQTPNVNDIVMVTAMRLPSVTHGFNDSTYLSKLGFVPTVNGLTVTAPATGNVAPPGPYLLFLITGNGVPSVGKVIYINSSGTPDTTPPSVSLSSPAAGSTVAGAAITLSAEATDNVAVAAVDFLIDGVTLYTDTTPPFGVTWNTTIVVNGGHTVTAVARDGAGNSASADVSVTVDNQDSIPPVVTLTAPTNGTTVQGTSVTLSASASDNLALASVQFKIDDVDVGAPLHIPPFQVTWNSATSTNGLHTVTAVARDVGGNTTTSTAVNVTVQNATSSCPPIPLNVGAAYKEPSFAYLIETSFGTAPDDDNHASLSTLRLFENNVELGPPHSLHVEIRNFGSGRFSHYGNPNTGYESLVFSASDNSDPRTNGRQYTYCIPGPPQDIIPPTVNLISPLLGATISGTQVNVSAAAADDGGIAQVQFKLDSTNLGLPVTVAPYALVWDSTTASNGPHTLSAVATDAAGNISVSTGIEVVIANPTNSCSRAVLSLNRVETDGGAAYLIYGNFGTPGDSSGSPSRSVLKLYEDDTFLGPAHALHSSIRTLGAGRFSHWGSNSAQSLRFSASDNSDPRSNGRVYSFCVPSGEADVAAPSVALISPIDSAQVAGNVSLRANATDNIDVVGVQFKVDDVDIGLEDLTSPYEIVWNSATVTNGPHVLTALARDAAGNRTLSTLVTVNVLNVTDDVAPTVTLTAPAQNASLSGSAVNLAAAASDNIGVAGVQFKVDGNNIGIESTSPPFAISWNTTSVANGPHTLTAVARDLVGNIATSDPVTVTVANQADNCVLIPINLTAAYSDGGLAVLVEQTFNVLGDTSSAPTRSTLRVFENDTALPLPHATHANIRNLGRGRYSHWTNADNSFETLRFSATDTTDPRNNGRTYSYCLPSESADTVAPSVVISAPQNDATVGGAAVSVTASAVDNIAVSGVQFLLDGVALNAEDTVPPYAVVWNTTTVSDGLHVLSATARDAAGNVGQAEVLSVRVVNAVDQIPPTVVITAPNANTTVSGLTVGIAATAADNQALAGVQFKLDGTNLGVEDTSTPYGLTWNTSTVANGAHVLTAVARDIAGNTTLSDPVDIIVSNSTSGCTVLPLDVSSAYSQGSFGYLLERSFGTATDTEAAPTQSRLSLFENGAALGPAHALHSNIATLGGGRYSHWNNLSGTYETLRFSATDNSDPRINGRSYGYCVQPQAVP